MKPAVPTDPSEVTVWLRQLALPTRRRRASCSRCSTKNCGAWRVRTCGARTPATRSAPPGWRTRPGSAWPTRRARSGRTAAHFLAVASTMMRRILVNHELARRADKRDAELVPVTLSGLEQIGVEPDRDLVAVHEALLAFEQVDARAAKVVELRFFGGLENDEAGAGAGRVAGHHQARLGGGARVAASRTVAAFLSRLQLSASRASRGAVPVDVVAAQPVEVGAVQHACQHEQQVGQPVQVLARRLVHRFDAGQRHQRALGAPRHGAADVRQRRAAGAGRQDEFLSAAAARRCSAPAPGPAAAPHRPSAVRSRGSTVRRPG